MVGLEMLCQVFFPINYSGKEDTLKTIEQIKIHNRIWVELCTNKPDKQVL